MRDASGLARQWWVYASPDRRTRWRLVGSAALAIGAAGSAIGLLLTSAWLISRAAEHPPILYLMVAIVAVRAFGLGRAAHRYVKRLVGHDTAFRLLAAVRVAPTQTWRHGPRALRAHRVGDLVSRLVADTGAVQDLVLRCWFAHDRVGGVVDDCGARCVLVPTAGFSSPERPPSY